MDYWANVDAVTWFAQRVFPVDSHGGRRSPLRHRRRHGRTRQVRAARLTPGRRGHGRRRRRPALSRARGRRGRAAARRARDPEQGARGHGDGEARGHDVRRAGRARLSPELRRGGDSAEGFADAVLALLRSPSERVEIGTLGRAWVQENHDWARTLRPVADLIENGGDSWTRLRRRRSSSVRAGRYRGLGGDGVEALPHRALAFARGPLPRLLRHVPVDGGDLVALRHLRSRLLRSSNQLVPDLDSAGSASEADAEGRRESARSHRLGGSSAGLPRGSAGSSSPSSISPWRRFR